MEVAIDVRAKGNEETIGEVIAAPISSRNEAWYELIDTVYLPWIKANWWYR